MPFWRPSRPGTSKLSSDCTNISRIAETIAGRTSGMVMRRSSTCRGAPASSAASSSAGSMLRKAAAISRKAIGARCSPWTQIMPHMLKVLNRPWPRIGLNSSALISPILGSARKIHDAA